MEPVFGFLLYFAAVAVVSVVASKRGLPGWLYAIGCLVAAPVVVVVVSRAGGSVAAAFAAFLVPVVAFFIAMSSDTDERRAVTGAESSEYKKCPHCAESVRKEAIKCRHCGSSLSTTHPMGMSDIPPL